MRWRAAETVPSWRGGGGQNAWRACAMGGSWLEKLEGYTFTSVIHSNPVTFYIQFVKALEGVLSVEPTPSS